MFRRVALVGIVVAAASLFDVRSSGAAPLSSNNPYRSFNISGVNYGSVTWERSHRRARGGGYAHRGILFRRR